MGQYAVLAVLAAFVLGGTVLYNAQRSAQGADDELNAYQGDRLSRETALAGLKRMERRLAANLDAWDDTESPNTTTRDAARALFNAASTAYGAGTYAITFDDYVAGGATTSDLAYVTAVGRSEGERFVIRAIYEKGFTDQGTPPQMRQAFVADERIYFNGNVSVYGGIHTNGTLTSAQSNSFDVYGTGTYVGGESVPDDRFHGTPPLQQGDSILVSTVTIPSTYTHRAASAAQLLDQNSQVTTSGIMLTTGSGRGTTAPTTITGAGTADNPYVLVVNGNLDVSGAVHLRGYMRIYVNGDLSITGNSTRLTPTDPSVSMPTGSSTPSQIQAWIDSNLPNGNQIGLYVTGAVRVSGNPTIAANIYANHEIEYWGSGGRLIIGSFTSQDVIDSRGTSSIYFTAASRTIYDPGMTRRVPEGVRLIAYREYASR